MKLWLLIQSIFKPDIVWEYGMCSGKIARKHKITGKVQYLLWRRERNDQYDRDYWCDMSDSWWHRFNKY